MLCPKDFKPCIDSLCANGRCFETGEAMYRRCAQCDALVSDDDWDDCICKDDFGYAE